MLERRVEPEILDELPESHPVAVHNRRDLRIINRIMGNYSWFSRVFGQRRLLHRSPAILELGAGDGELGQVLLRRFGSDAIGSYTAVDTTNRPPRWPRAWEWEQGDLRAFAYSGDRSLVIGNLILHQFEDDDLGGLGAQFDRYARWLVFNEPVRRRRHQWLLKLGVFLNFNRVTHLDGATSIRAGFLGEELPRLLRLDPDRWEWRCSHSLFGGYRMVAWRKH